MIGPVLSLLALAAAPWEWPMGQLPPLAEDFHTVCAWPAGDARWQERRASGDYHGSGDLAGLPKRLTRTVDGVEWTVTIEVRTVPASVRSPALEVNTCTVTGADPDDRSRSAIEAWAGGARPSADGITRIAFTTPRPAYDPVSFDAGDEMAERQLLEAGPIRRIELSKGTGGLSFFRSIHVRRASK